MSAVKIEHTAVKIERTVAELSGTIKLISSDGHSFEIERTVAELSGTVTNMLEDEGGDEVHLANVTGSVLAPVVKYCKDRTAHVKAMQAIEGTASESKKADELKRMTEIEKELVEVDQSMLFDLILAANYLNIKPLLDVTCLTVANMIKGKTPEQIRIAFNIKNDFTPEEEEEVRRESRPREPRSQSDGRGNILKFVFGGNFNFCYYKHHGHDAYFINRGLAGRHWRHGLCGHEF